MVKTLTYDNQDHKIKLKIRQFQVMGKSTRQINNHSMITLKLSSSWCFSIGWVRSCSCSLVQIVNVMRWFTVNLNQVWNIIWARYK